MEGDKITELIITHKELLHQLTDITADHEKRLRNLERLVTGIMSIGALVGLFIKFLSKG